MGSVSERTFFRGEVHRVGEVCKQDDVVTYLLVDGIGCAEMPNDAWELVRGDRSSVESRSRFR